MKILIVSLAALILFTAGIIAGAHLAEYINENEIINLYRALYGQN